MFVTGAFTLMSRRRTSGPSVCIVRRQQSGNGWLRPPNGYIGGVGSTSTTQSIAIVGSDGTEDIANFRVAIVVVRIREENDLQNHQMQIPEKDSTLDAMQRARLRRDMKVQVGDVQSD